MNSNSTAIYARVSSDRQVDAHTIASQLAALDARVAADGLVAPAELRFVDEGYSGATLIRPALERLRDVAAAGGIDRIYVHSPDRLARNYAYQVVLLDELQRNGVTVIFLNRELVQTPEDALLLQVQGMVAEYERAKILERSRRGKRHAAQMGAVSVLGLVPYGYRYISKADGGGSARWEVIPEEAEVVRQIFHWVGCQRLTLSAVCRRLEAAGVLTRTGKRRWDRTTLWGMLKNPAYVGQAAFGRTRAEPLQRRLRPQRGKPVQPRRAIFTKHLPPDEWIRIPVPALVEPDVFAGVQEQLRENQQRARHQRRGARFLLQGLLTCRQCRYAFYGKAARWKDRQGTIHEYAYYRCIGTDGHRFGGEQVCGNPELRVEGLDAAVWQAVCDLLEHPGRLMEEYHHRRDALEATHLAQEVAMVQARRSKVRQGIARLIDGYAEGLLEKEEFEPRITRLRQRLSELDVQIQELTDAAAGHAEVEQIIGCLEEFAAQVRTGLGTAEWATRRAIIRALVKSIELDRDQVYIVFRVGADPFELRPEGRIWQHCWKRVHADAR